MATPIGGAGIVLWTLEYNVAGQRLLTTQYLQSSTAGTITDYQAEFAKVLTDINTAGQLIALLKVACSSNVTFVRQSMQPVYPTRYAAVTQTFPAGTVGTRSGAALPPNVAFTMTKRSVNATRWGIGSAHLPLGVAADVLSSGIWSTGLLGAAVDIATWWPNGWGGITSTYSWYPKLWSKVTPARITSITEVIPQGTIRVERRRTVGLGI